MFVKELFYASVIGGSETETVVTLIDAGVDVNKRFLNSTALVEASSKGHSIIASTLLNAGADVDMPELIMGFTPLFKSCFNGQIACVRILLNSNASVNKVTNFGEIALHAACAISPNHIEIINTLISSGSNVNKQNNVGQTPLYWACTNLGNELAIKTLIKYGADVRIADKYGILPIDIAYQNKDNIVVDILNKEMRWLRRKPMILLKTIPSDLRRPISPLGLLLTDTSRRDSRDIIKEIATYL